jgi:hypothetical protein
MPEFAMGARCRAPVEEVWKLLFDPIVWQLAEADPGTSITVNGSVPERQAGRLDWQHDVIEQSLRRLTALAEAA